MSRNILDDVRIPDIGSIDEDLDDLFIDAVKVVIQYDRASAALIQRRLSVGYARAARILDQLEATGVVGPADGSIPRDVLIKTLEDVKGVEFPKNKKEEESQEYEEILPYKKPKTGIIKKPTISDWKYSLYDVVNSKKYSNSGDYSFPIGFANDELIVKDLNDYTHLSIVGNNISNKEVMADTILTSLLLKFAPHELKLILIDPTRYLSYYDNLPHLLTPVITDHEKNISALRWLLSEMDRRIRIFEQSGVRDFVGFNKLSGFTALPKIIVMINNYEDVSLFSPVEVEDSVFRITHSGHKSGINMFIIIDRLTNQEVSREIQSKITNKIFFRLTNVKDSGPSKVRGVDKLGKGEAIYLSGFENEPRTLDAIYTSEENVKAVVSTIISTK
jgi:DNA segregation ATPase FtsK/SpoIIIE-like protein